MTTRRRLGVAERAALTPVLHLSWWKRTGVLALLLIVAGRDAFGSGHSIVGWVEEGLLLPDPAPVQMKLDSGARTSSVDGLILARFERHGRPWIQFRIRIVDDARHEPRSIVYERPVRRRVAIRGAGDSDHRPVVHLEICVGAQVLSEDFSIADRSRMRYPVLLGRHAIAQLGLLDVSRKRLTSPHCRPSAARAVHLTMDRSHETAFPRAQNGNTS